MAVLILPCCVTRRTRVQTCKRWWTMFWARSLYHHMGEMIACTYHNSDIIVCYILQINSIKSCTHHSELHQTLLTCLVYGACNEWWDTSHCSVEPPLYKQPHAAHRHKLSPPSMEPPPDPPLVTPATRPGSSGHRAGEQVAGAGEWWVELETKVREDSISHS